MRTRNRKKSLPIRKAPKKKKSPAVVPLAQEEVSSIEALKATSDELYTQLLASNARIDALDSRLKAVVQKYADDKETKTCSLVPTEPSAKNSFGRFVPKTEGNYRFFCPYVSN
jgi:hypothetical protein